MIGITPEKVRRNIAAICAVSQFNEHIRSHVIDEADLSTAALAADAPKYVEARRHVAEAVQWKVFSHCAAVTRLYALYEAFVYDLISAWLKIVPSLYPSYAQLPDALITQHRVGVGVLLQKFGGGARTEELTELGIVGPLYLGLSGHQSFALVADAFFIDLRNLRHEELCGLFRRASLGDLDAWLSGHSELQAMCDSAGTTLAGRLKELVEYRNEAAHAREEITETLGVSAFLEIADFIQALCSALHQFVVVRYVDVLQDAGRLETLGTITEYLPQVGASILTVHAAARVSVGDDVVARGRWTCFPTKIVDLRDHDRPIQTFEGVQGHELGVKFDTQVSRKGSTIFRLRPSVDTAVRLIDATDQAGAAPAPAR
jgi:hypothetical protein